MKHVLVIPSWYKSIEFPVRGSFFEEQARALQKMGVKVGIIAPELFPFSSKIKGHTDWLDDKGILTCTIKLKMKLPRLRAINYHLFQKRINHLFTQYCTKNGNPDIIHAHSVFFGGIAAMGIAKEFKLPYVITEHLTDFSRGKVVHPYDLKISRNVFMNARLSAAVSKSFATKLTDLLRMPSGFMQVIPNMVSDIFFEGFIEKEKSDDSGPVIFTNAFFSKRKRIDILIEAFIEFQKHFPNARLRIGGDIMRDEDRDYKGQLIKLVENSGLKSKIDFLGMLNRNEVKQELDNCHFFALASEYETFGVVIIEALACGRPVVVYKSEAPAEFVKDSDGILVENLSLAGFSDGFTKLWKNYTSFDQKKIQGECRFCFAESVISQNLLRNYDGILSGFKTGN